MRYLGAAFVSGDLGNAELQFRAFRLSRYYSAESIVRLRQASALLIDIRIPIQSRSLPGSGLCESARRCW